MPDIDFSKGLILAQLVKSPKTVTTFMKDRNSGWSNLEKFPWRLKKLGVFQAEQWRNLDDFKSWLQNSFSHLDSGTYYLIGYRGSLKYKKVGFKKYKKVRPYEGVCKFLVSSGNVTIPSDFQKSRRTHKTYRIFLVLSDSSDKREEAMQELKAQRIRGKITIRR
jgi:hypothetical protein